MAGPLFLPKLNVGLRVSQYEILQAESRTSCLVTSFQSRDPQCHFRALVLGELVVIILSFLPVVTVSAM